MTDCNYVQNYVSIVKCTGNKSEQKKQGPFTLTINTEKTKLVRYLLHLWVQIEGKDCN